jgi:hypothetical protein
MYVVLLFAIVYSNVTLLSLTSFMTEAQLIIFQEVAVVVIIRCVDIVVKWCGEQV